MLRVENYLAIDPQCLVRISTRGVLSAFSHKPSNNNFIRGLIH